MTIQTTAYSRTGRLRDVLRRRDGAVDMPSIMTGAIILGLLTAAIVGAVFTIIPWSQDAAAKQKVSQVVAAQSSYYAMDADTAANPSYGTQAELNTKGLLTDTTNNIAITVREGTGGASKDGFTVTVTSDTGNRFTANEANPKPVAAPPAQT